MNHISKFRKTFKIDPKANLSEVAVAVGAIYEADQIATAYLGEIDPTDNSAGFRIHSLLNLLGRTFEHTQAMLVAVSTGSPASAEALARIVVEGSMNVMYLATLGDSGTLLRFFRSWLSEHNRKLTEWKLKIQGEAYANKVSAMIEDRRGVIVAFEAYLTLVETQCSIKTTAPSADWPKSLFKRFEAMGRETDYYESYHRLSGSSHINGEDTLSWLVALDLPNEQRHLLGLEAWAYSIMMTRIASRFFVEAAVSCTIAYGRLNNDDLQKCRSALGDAVHSIAQAAGVPIGRRH